jgi:hypothetical protein
VVLVAALEAPEETVLVLAAVVVLAYSRVVFVHRDLHSNPAKIQSHAWPKWALIETMPLKP